MLALQGFSTEQDRPFINIEGREMGGRELTENINKNLRSVMVTRSSQR